MTANFTPGQPEPAPQHHQTKTQCAVIICLKRRVVSVVDRLVPLLEQQAEDPTRVVFQSYGIMQKQYDGYLVVECRGGFPREFLELLRNDDGVEEYVVFDRVGPRQGSETTSEDEGGARA